MKMIIWVLWPAFAAAGIAELVFFTLIDPQQLFLLGQPIEVSPMAAYSIGFLLFWLVCTGASLMTYFMLPAEIKKALSRHADEHPDLTRRGRTRPAQ
jgi:hypothetical protein